MAPKGAKKKDPMAPTLIPEDTFNRVKKMKAILDPKSIKPPKGELNEEFYVIPPALHTLPELKQVIQYYKQGSTVQYKERKEMSAPTRSEKISDEAYLVDNSQLKSTDNVMPYRVTKQMDDKDPSGTCAIFGSTIMGTDEGDGWVKVGIRFLPLAIRGTPVLTLLTQASVKKAHPRKEIQDLLKYLNTMKKQASKRTDKYLKQLENKEKKMMKRDGLKLQITDVDNLMNEELRSARRFQTRQGLFDKKNMTGSKLGETAPKQRVLIVIELSDKQQLWVDETKDEVTKLMKEVILAGETTTFQLATFSASGQNPWIPSAPFQAKDDPKKGLDDAIKWMGKNFSAKTCSSQSFPPDWNGMLNRFAGDGQMLPFKIFICCSKSPDRSSAEVLECLAKLREQDAPSKHDGILPINVVAFDPSIVGDDDEKAFFDAIAGEKGQFKIDTSQEDLQALDKMLKAVGAKKKQLDKFTKKLIKMEEKDGKDLPDRVTEDRGYLVMEMALQRMLENDWEIFDWAFKNEAPIPGPEI